MGATLLRYIQVYSAQFQSRWSATILDAFAESIRCLLQFSNTNSLTRDPWSRWQCGQVDGVSLYRAAVINGLTDLPLIPGGTRRPVGRQSGPAGSGPHR